MKTSTVSVFAILFIVSSFGIINFDSVFASSVYIDVKTDKGTYHEGEIIKIYGNINNSQPFESILITVNDPFGKIVDKRQVSLNDKNKFVINIDTSKQLMSVGGSYSITVHHYDAIEKIYFSYYIPAMKKIIKIPTEFIVIIKPSQQIKVGEEYCIIAVLLDSTTKVVYPVSVSVSFEAYQDDVFYMEDKFSVVTDHSGFAMNTCKTMPYDPFLNNVNIQFEFMGDEKYLPTKSNIYNVRVLNSQTQTTPTPIPTQTQTTPTHTPTQKSLSSNTSNENFPIEYVIAGTVIAPVAVIGIVLSKRKKTAVIAVQPAKAQTKSDETQFWVCPHCGRDTQMKYGKQFCNSCNMYL